jgi:CRISPR-associated protein Cas5d
MKVERVSYDVMTPSAARAIFEAILWKPAIQWHIRKIEVLNPVRWISLRRNELGSIIPLGNVQKAMKGSADSLACYIEDDRQQRAGLLLRDVKYRIHGDFSLTKHAEAADNPGKFAEMFRRRANKGQCFNQPYLGCREFSCSFKLIDDASSQQLPICVDHDLGWMLYDLDFSEPTNPKPLFFKAQLQQGVLHVPEITSQEVRG